MPRPSTAPFLGTHKETFAMPSPCAVEKQAAGYSDSNADGLDRRGTPSHAETCSNPRSDNVRPPSDSRAQRPLTSRASISAEKVFHRSSGAPCDSSRVLRHQEEQSVVSRSTKVPMPVATTGSAQCVQCEGVCGDRGRGRSEAAGRMAFARCDVMAILLDAWHSVFPAQATRG